MSKKRYNNKNNTKKTENKKIKYKLRNWSEYNRSLKQRGSITFWFNKEVSKNWLFRGPHKQGAPLKYSNIAIETLLTIRCFFKLPLRGIEGYIKSLIALLKLNIDIPDYTTLCRRQSSLKVPIKHYSRYSEPIHVILDSTGLKVFGEGEWKVRRYGYTKRRSWRKLHLAIDNKGNIIASDITNNNITDSIGAKKLIDSVKEIPINKLIGDAGYDKKHIYEFCHQNSITPIVHTQKNARIRDGDIWEKRNSNIIKQKKLGKEQWKKDSGYSKRSLVENTVFRYKKTFTDKPQAYLLKNQAIEVSLKCNILNKFLALGRPVTYAVSS